MSTNEHDVIEELEDADTAEAEAELETSAVATSDIEIAPAVPSPPSVKRAPGVTATVYCVARRVGSKSGAFMHEMRELHGNLARKTMTEWDVEWRAFWDRPVTG